MSQPAARTRLHQSVSSEKRKKRSSSPPRLLDRLAAREQEAPGQPVGRLLAAVGLGPRLVLLEMGEPGQAREHQRLAELARGGGEAADRSLELAVGVMRDGARDADLGARVHRRDELRQRALDDLDVGVEQQHVAAARGAQGDVVAGGEADVGPAHDRDLAAARARSRPACRRSSRCRPPAIRHRSGRSRPAPVRSDAQREVAALMGHDDHAQVRPCRHRQAENVRDAVALPRARNRRAGALHCPDVRNRRTAAPRTGTASTRSSRRGCARASSTAGPTRAGSSAAAAPASGSSACA